MPPRSKQPLPAAADEPRRASRARGSRASQPRPEAVTVRADVTAVLVAHDGAEWLPEALTALAASAHAPARVLCVDTGSSDESLELMASAYGEVLSLPRTTGFGAAVHAALAAAGGSTTWIWLLHDDVAVEPGTLGQLLAHAESSPSAALLGPKVRDWNDPRFLVEVGITTDAAGHRETGLERREYDQGQRDDLRDVLAVGTAAALVRRDVWDAVGGLDPALTVFRDDLDLGWKVNAAGHRVVVVPAARIRHARAATTGHRETDAAPGRATGVDRRHALFVLLAHASALRLLGLLPRLLLATAFRSLGLLLTRQVAAAGDEWGSLLAVLARPGRLHAARRSRARTRTVSQRELRPLFASRALRLRARAAAFGAWVSGGGQASPAALGALGDPGSEASDEFDLLDYSGGGAVRRALLRPGVLLVAGLTLVSLLAERSLLHGGRLVGGALLPAPDGASDLWRAYGGAWHDVGVGTGQAAPPGTAAVALLSTLLLGNASFAVTVLLLGSVPLAGLTAYLAASRLVRHTYLRLWAAATWALLPVATGAVAAGRLNAAAVQVALPLVVLAAGRLLTDDPRVEGWWRAWALGLGLGVTCSFAPQLWPLSALVLLMGAAANLAVDGGRRRALAAVLVAVVPGAMMLPWSLQALAHPSMFLPRPQVAQAALPAWHVLLLSPGGPGLPSPYLAAGLVLAALAGTVRLSFRRLALACWGVAVVGYAAALLLTHLQVGGLPVWPGIALQVAGLGLLTAALIAANGARSRLARISFGWRQPAAGVVALLAALLPLVAAVGWVARGADDPLQRDASQTLPAFARAELENRAGLRVLVLSRLPDGRLEYALSNGDGTGLADVGLRSSTAQRAALDTIVADLASPRGSDAAEALSTRAVRYVALKHPDGTLISVLDAQPGLVRRTSGELTLWQVVAPSARLSLLSPELGAQAVVGDRAPRVDLLRSNGLVALPTGVEGARATITPGPDGRVLVLADAADGHWQATLNGKQLDRRTAWGWAQGFLIPSEGGRLVLTYDQSARRLGLAAQGGVLLLVAVLAAPGARRRRGLEDDVDEEDDDVQPIAERRVPVAAL